MWQRMTVLLLTLATSCGGPQRVAPPPSWYGQPPVHTASNLYFVGDASGQANEETARELAIQKALAALTHYCGAVVKADFNSVEVETNGRSEQSVSLTVDVAGEELTLREVAVKSAVVRPGREGVDGFVLIRWPRAQYTAVLARQRARGQRALDIYLSAEAALESLQIQAARTRLREAQHVLGPARAEVQLEDSRFAHTGLLWDALEAFQQRLDEFEAARQKVVAVGVDCAEAGSSVRCPPERLGHIREQVTAKGFQVSSQKLSSTVARHIADSSSPRVNTQLRRAGYIIAAIYNANVAGTEDGFTFARCGARAVLYDTDSQRILQTTEVDPKKGGHIHAKGAIKRGCAAAERDLVTWISGVLATIQGQSSQF